MKVDNQTMKIQNDANFTRDTNNFTPQRLPKFNVKAEKSIATKDEVH